MRNEILAALRCMTVNVKSCCDWTPDIKIALSENVRVLPVESVPLLYKRTKNSCDMKWENTGGDPWQFWVHDSNQDSLSTFWVHESKCLDSLWMDPWYQECIIGECSSSSSWVDSSIIQENKEFFLHEVGKYGKKSLTFWAFTFTYPLKWGNTERNPWHSEVNVKSRCD